MAAVVRVLLLLDDLLIQCRALLVVQEGLRDAWLGLREAGQQLLCLGALILAGLLRMLVLRVADRRARHVELRSSRVAFAARRIGTVWGDKHGTVSGDSTEHLISELVQHLTRPRYFRLE